MARIKKGSKRSSHSSAAKPQTHNTFSELPAYRKRNEHWLAGALIKRHNVSPTRLENTTHSRRLKLLQRSDRGFLIYENCTTRELWSFVVARGLPLHAHAENSKTELIKLLEKADEKSIDLRLFMKLPRELREMVFAEYFRDWRRMCHSYSPLDFPVSRKYYAPPLCMVENAGSVFEILKGEILATYERELKKQPEREPSRPYVRGYTGFMDGGAGQSETMERKLLGTMPVV